VAVIDDAIVTIEQPGRRWHTAGGSAEGAALTDGTRIPIRTITLNLRDRHPVAGEAIGRAGSILRSAESFYATHGYESQTVRLSMRSALRDLIDWSPRAILDYAEDLEASLRACL
jgi:hypothetical protein